jgi:glycosyltransferase involved in cell wall biosynthesis
MARVAGFECIFMSRSARVGLVSTFLDYVRLSWQTWRLLRRRKPSVLWVQLPPVALLWVALAARRLILPNMKLVADCHNAMFRPPWSRVPGGVSWLRHCDVVLAHNNMVASDALALGVPAQRLRVLEEVPPEPIEFIELGFAQMPRCLPPHLPRPWVLFPGSFLMDEPIAELAAAAAAMPNASFIVTGRLERVLSNGHDLGERPPNFFTPGYVDRSDFDRLLCAADLVLALTRLEGIQLSVCNEALGFGKPMVVSGTHVLRSLFGEACEVAVDHRPETLVAAARSALARRKELAMRARSLARTRLECWRSRQYADVQALLGGTSKEHVTP